VVLVLHLVLVQQEQTLGLLIAALVVVVAV
jgi:hypothetical protein